MGRQPSRYRAVSAARTAVSGSGRGAATGRGERAPPCRGRLQPVAKVRAIFPPSQFCRFIKSRSAAGSNLLSVETDQLRERHPDPCVTPIVTPRKSACGYQPGTRAQRGLAEEPGGAGAG